jgi:TolA-binding protein
MSEPSNHPMPIGEIVQGPSAFEQFLEKNQKLIALSAVVVALAIGGVMVYRTIQQDHAAEAAASLSAAKDIAAMEKVKLDYADTPSAVTAAMGIADKLWGNGQQDEAITALKEIIEKFPQHPASVVAQNTLGYRLMAQGKNGDATLAFQAVIDRESERYLAPSAMIALGDLAKKEGNLEKASEHYKKVSAEFKDSPFASMAADRMKFLRFASPTEIEPPPAPAPEKPSTPETPTGASIGSTNPMLDALSNGSKEKKDEAPAPAPVQNPPASQP